MVEEEKQENYVIKKAVNGLQNINAVLIVKDQKDSLKNNIVNTVVKNKIFINNKMEYEAYFYYSIIILGLSLIIYQIHKYGLRGYLDRRLERKRRKYDMFYNTVHNLHI